MNIGGLIRSVMNELQASEPKALELKVGEVVKGMVLQLLSETDAIINIGGVQVRAKLETPLKQGEVTLLQVQPNHKSGQIVMKPLGASGVQIAESSLAEVLKNVGLPDTSTNRQIIQMLHQSGVSLNKDNVQAFAQLNGQMPSSVLQEEWIPSAVIAFQKGIPLTSDTVMAVKQAIHGQPFHETIQELDIQLTKLLAEQPSLSTSNKTAIDSFKSIVVMIKEAATQLLPQASAQIAAVELDKMLSSAKQAANQQSSSISADMSADEAALNARNGVKLAASASAGSQAGGTAQPVLTEQHAQPDHTRIAREKAAAAFNVSSTAGNQALLKPQDATLSRDFVPVPPSQAASAGSATSASASTHSEADLKDSSADAQAAASAALSRPASETLQRTGASISSKAEEARFLPTGASASTEDEHWISKLIKSVGVEHEHQLIKLPERTVGGGQFLTAEALFDQDPKTVNLLMPDPSKSVETLKNALLTLAQSNDIPAALKETVQQAIQQITGQQLLLNIDRASMFTNITMFIPLINANGEQTAAIHIQSRKGARGDIDSSNCRLVFDLKMKALGDTMVDVQVVDRIVSLRVLNDQPFIQQLLETHREEIAAGLSKVGYQFISLKCSAYPDKATPSEDLSASGKQQETVQAAELPSIYKRKPYKGMDLRV